MRDDDRRKREYDCAVGSANRCGVQGCGGLGKMMIDLVSRLIVLEKIFLDADEEGTWTGHGW